MLDIICTRKEKTRVILFFEIYKMMLIIFKYENCSYTGHPPRIDQKGETHYERKEHLYIVGREKGNWISVGGKETKVKPQCKFLATDVAGIGIISGKTRSRT